MTHDATQPFLATIEADRDREIEQIQTDADAQIERIIGEAHAEARRLQRDTNVRLRRELSVRQHKETSRVQARIRRKRWQSLKQLQSGINQQVLERMCSAWAEPEWQWHWCRFWLQAALERNDDTPLRLAISETALPKTLEQIAKWAKQNKLSLEFDGPLPELGLIIRWADFELDGLISAQGHTIEAAVLARLTPRLHQVDTTILES